MMRYEDKKRTLRVFSTLDGLKHSKGYQYGISRTLLFLYLTILKDHKKARIRDYGKNKKNFIYSITLFVVIATYFGCKSYCMPADSILLGIGL
ncbi:hypothetical protein [Enterococcus bulliens]